MPKRVLIVDDAVFMRNMIRDIFSSGGYEVVGEATHGIEAIEAGAADFIVKPFRAEDVLSVVKKVLGETPKG